MGISIGTRLGPYEVLAPLGAGGMGEVYRARDIRLEREVAIKVLPESFASDPDRLHRFKQEARAVAALNHPNILSVHDIGLEGDIQFMVTELLEGQSLREALMGGPLPPRRVIDYGVQITQGLSAAHNKGIVHRDLKPENLFLTKDGRVKILDFGLARQMETPGTHQATTVADTSHTAPGTVFGTVGYMSPEQVRGEAVGQRTDIFALGAVMYEMLSGKRAFQRSSTADIISAILKEDPPEIAAGGDRQISPAIQRIVLRCLEKDHEQRFQSAKDVGFALESVSGGTSQAQPILAPPITARNRWRVAAVVFSVLFFMAAALVVRLLMRRSQLPEYQQLSFRRGSISAARFAPDGETIVYSAAWDRPESRLYRSRVDGSEMTALDLPPARLIAVSRTREMALRLSNGHLARVPLGGGAPREWLPDVITADWSPDGAALAVARFENGKCRLEYPLGNVLYETIGSILFLRLSPKGDAIAFMDYPIRGDDRGTVAIVDLKGHKRTLTREWNGEQGLAWSPDGNEIWFTATTDLDWQRSLYAVNRLGKLRLVLSGPAALYLEDISSDGRVLLRREERRYEVAVSQAGGTPRLLSWRQIMQASDISRDGQYVVITDNSSETNYRVYLAKFDGSPAVMLGSGASAGISPDNKWVASILPTDTSKVLLLPSGLGETRTVTAPNFHYRDASWASDGHTLVVRASEADHPLRFWVQDIEGGAPLAVTPEGVSGLFVTINHSDYVCARDLKKQVQLYSIDGKTQKWVVGVPESDGLIGGSPNAEDLYVTPDPSAVPMQVDKISLITGRRQPFVRVSPADLAGVLGLFGLIFTPDEKRYVYTQFRSFSVLYLVDRLH
jgi:eukaryotic-like serine/threonine-protein kinase